MDRGHCATLLLSKKSFGDLYEPAQSPESSVRLGLGAERGGKVREPLALSAIVVDIEGVAPDVFGTIAPLGTLAEQFLRVGAGGPVRGARFTFTLPAADVADAGAGHAARLPAPPHAGVPRLNGERWNGIAAEVLFFLTYEPDLLQVYDPKSTERAFPTPSAGRWRPSSPPTVGVAFRCGRGAG